MKKIFIILLAVLANPIVMGQKLTEQDHLKYWYYRHRLNTEFIRHGLEQNLCEGSGLNLPAVAANNYRGKYSSKNLTLSWIDNPGQYLGRYIGVLATKLALLYKHGQPYDSTQKELYYAMKAYARIDYNCECLFYPDAGDIGQKNGLFCRSDVPADFLDGEREWCDSNYYVYDVESHYKTYHLDFEDQPNEAEARNETFYVSGEEWQGLQTGFALLVYALKDCPAEVVIYNGYRFIEEAILHTQRNLDYLIEDGWVGRLSNDQMYKYGADGLKYQGLYGMVKAADFICDPDRDYLVPLTFTPEGDYSEIFNYHNPLLDPALPLFLLDLGIVEGFDEIGKLWLYGEYTGNFLFRYQKYFWLKLGDPHCKLGTIDDFGILFNNVNKNGDTLRLRVDYPFGSETFKVYRGKRHVVSSPYSWAAIGDSWTIDNLFPQDMTFETLCTYTDDVNWDFFPLLNHYLYNKNKTGAPYLRQKIVNHLITAPCAGPHYLPHFSRLESDLYRSEGTEGWRSHFRWDKYYNDAMFGPDTTDTVKNWIGAKYNGIDYMIAYNLLWLDCIQGGVEDRYFDENILYQNRRDTDCNAMSNGDLDVFFKFNGPVNKTTVRTWSSPYPADVIVTGESILLSGGYYFGGDGHTLEIIPDHKVTQCEIEQFLDN